MSEEKFPQTPEGFHFRHLEPQERTVLFYFQTYPNQLLTWDEIAFNCWGIKADRPAIVDLRQYLRRLRPLLEEEVLATLSSHKQTFGVVYFPQSPEEAELTLTHLGVSLFLNGADERKVIPGLSVLDRQSLDKSPVDIDLDPILELLDKLTLTEAKTPWLTPYLSSLQRQLLICFLKNNPPSLIDLVKASEIRWEKDWNRYCDYLWAQERLRANLSDLRQKIKPWGLEISFEGKRRGWSLMPMPTSTSS